MGHTDEDGEEYPPEIQRVIDRYLAGELEVKTPVMEDPAKRPRPPRVKKDDWHKTYESAKKALDNRKRRIR